MSLYKQITWLSLFSIAMGFMESAIVVYLREIYYPEGFNFPLIPIEKSIAIVEILREAATIIMLTGIGILTGRSATEKFTHFIFCFAVWDIFYYIFLKLILGWPESLFTWDILFLIPVPWVGPVLAPCILSASMITLALLVSYFNNSGLNVNIGKSSWYLLISGSLIVIFTFIEDYIRYLLSAPDIEKNPFVPYNYNWVLFCVGEIVLLIGIYLFLKKYRTKISIE